MKSIDWYYLRRSLVLFVVSLAFALSLGFAGYLFEKAQLEEYEYSLSSLRSTHRLYTSIINDIDLLEQYRNLYSDFKASGLVGEERRLSWVESLGKTNEILKLPKLSYNLRPQEGFIRPGFKVGRGVDVFSSPMDLNMDLLHEEDLFAVFQGLRLSIKNLFTVESCNLARNKSISATLDTQKANLNSYCTIRWITINAS